MADTGEGKKEEADYKRLHSFPLIRVRTRVGMYDHENVKVQGWEINVFHLYLPSKPVCSQLLSSYKNMILSYQFYLRAAPSYHFPMFHSTVRQLRGSLLQSLLMLPQ
ncbi:ras-related protein Rab-3A [Platysternon megacephalum]|uniref:Ras-related protein Rab-3A n=1 Tax=Platysternon megacephalum TaxID=55544 RepID=A0A4D9EJB3_9SAUR|nr:ras-related protein Rab-3A [Platysternon megacephalum]